MAIRLADESDAEQILRIYRPYVIETWITFELEPPSVEEVRQRVRDTRGRAAWLVSERDGEINGYAYAGRFNPRAAYQWTVETTVYVDRGHGRGVGLASTLRFSIAFAFRDFAPRSASSRFRTRRASAFTRASASDRPAASLGLDTSSGAGEMLAGGGFA
jgi:Acetyltransferase (GNAT) domain